jgi:ABC-type Mn2+/Zn2+ transport system ATPase subunit
MEIIIKNCNSIDEAKIEIEEGKLNIKYGVNGTGKSTIARAIELNTQGVEKLKDLTPFKYLEKKSKNGAQPSIVGAETIKSVSIFNESYINQFVFKQDEVITNSFEIFIKNEEYNQKIEEIEKLISGIKETFRSNESLDQVIKDLMDLSECFGKSKTGYSAAGSIAKGLGNGNKIENIPPALEAYSDFLKSDNNVSWIGWQIKGNDFMDISEACPYCTSSTQDKKENIKSVSKEYDAKSIEHLNKVLSIVERLNKYFSNDTNKNITEITKNKTGLSTEEINYLIEVKSQIDVLKDKLNKLKGITFFTFNDVEKVTEKVNSLKINIELLIHLNSEETGKIVTSINNSLDTVLTKAGLLQGEINKQKASIQKTIQEHKTEINRFLKFAGYKYFVDIESEGEEYKMKLKHEDFTESVSNGTQYLSYGEKNAFSLVLFMYESLAKNPDLIILDDPISSFDRNKKFAIIEMLFRRKKSFKGRTALMMTHDLEPIIDMVKNLPHKFEPVPMASFLESRNGVVNEIKINKSDVITFAQVCDENTGSQIDDIIKLVYLRRYYEIINDKGAVYQLLSNLLHKREKPTEKIDQDEKEMTEDRIKEASGEIRRKIPNFDYCSILAKLNDKNQMLSLYKNTTNNYEKLQMFRIIDEQHDSAVIKKYIDETFHIENEYVMQLNPCKYEIIPEFIVQECDTLLFNV